MAIKENELYGDPITVEELEKENPKAEETPKESEPKEEQKPSEESSLKNEDKETPSPESEEPQSEPTSDPKETPESQDDGYYDLESDEGVLEVLKDKYGKEFTTEQLKSFVEGEAEKEPENPFANDLAKEFNDFIKSGGDVEKYLQYKFVDYKNMDDAQVVLQDLKEQYPNLSDAEVQRKFNRTYKLNTEQYDEDEVEDSKTDLKANAYKARQRLIDEQSKFSAPLENKNQEQSQASEKEYEEFSQAVKGSLNNLNAIKVDDFEFKISQEDKKALSEMEPDINQLFIDDKGQFDVNKYNEARAKLANYDKAIKSAIEHGKSLQLKDVKQRRNNPQIEPEKQKPADGEYSKKQTSDYIRNQVGRTGMKINF